MLIHLVSSDGFKETESQRPTSCRCNRCNQPGHWNSDCVLARGSYGMGEIKRTTGIPRSFLKPASMDTPGAKINPQGLFMVNEMEEKAYSKKKIDKPIWDVDETSAAATAAPAPAIPEDLECPVCKDLFKDCIMMPMCACSVCDECARAALTEAENNNNACPACGTPDNSPEDLIPCRKVREKVNEFKSKNTGAAKVKAEADKARAAMPTLPDIILPGAGGGGGREVNHRGAADSPTYGMDERSPSVGSPDFLLSGNPLPPPGTSAAEAAAAAAGSRPSSPGTPLNNERTSPTPPPMQRPASPRLPRSSSRSPVRRRARSRSTSPREPRSRAVPLPDTSRPPPNFHRGKSKPLRNKAVKSSHYRVGKDSFKMYLI